MNIIDLREAQALFSLQIEDIEKNRKSLYDLRNRLALHFSVSKINSMKIKEYSLGMENSGVKFNFCHSLERDLDGLGRILGSTASKFGIYFGNTKEEKEYAEENNINLKKEFKITQRFGSNLDEAFRNIKESIIELVELGKAEDLHGIAKNLLSPMFKGKILSTYFPERYLNIFSPSHLNYYLKAFDLDTKALIKGNEIFKRETLFEFKNQDPVMKEWSNDIFATFLYSKYPGRPPKDKENGNNTNPKTNKKNITNDYLPPDFPINPEAEFIDLKITDSIQSESSSSSSSNKKSGKPNYDHEAKRNRLLGARGEKIVMDLELARLKICGRDDLADDIERISLNDDSLGYDIKSYDENGAERFIEVKATTRKPGLANFYYTANELRKGRELENYYIYVVFEVTSKKPKVWPIKNPFNPQDSRIEMTPVNYRVVINTES